MAILVYSVIALQIGLCGIGAFALGAPQKGVHLRMVVAAITSGLFHLRLRFLLGMMVCWYSLPRRSHVLGVLCALCAIELGALVSIGLVVLTFASFLHCSFEFCFAWAFLLVPIFFVVPFINAKLVGSRCMARLYKWLAKIFLFPTSRKRVLFAAILAFTSSVTPLTLTGIAL